MPLIFVRHGRTESNDPQHEKLRGWLPVPLTLEGMADAEQVAQELSQVEGITHLCCAVLVRVVQTATEIAEWVGLPIEPDEDLNDWNTGDFAGQGVKETLDDLHECINHPGKPVPGGESFQAWLDRIVPLLTKAVEGKDLVVIVSSGRVGTLLSALAQTHGEYPPTAVMLGKPPIDPAGVLFIQQDWEIAWKTPKAEESKGLS